MDFAAGRSVFNQKGVGLVRHLEVEVLRTQDQVPSGRVLIEKVEGCYNGAHLGTKPLGEDVLVRHRDALCLVASPEKFEAFAASVEAVSQGCWCMRSTNGRIARPVASARLATVQAGEEAFLTRKVDDDDGWTGCVLMLIVLIMTGAALGWCTRGMNGQLTASTRRAMSTQSRCLYAWSWADP